MSNLRTHQLLAFLGWLLVSINTTSVALSRDVVVIGGGASGAHAAVWLRDHGKSVAVIEKRHTLGGHTAVYHNPDTNKPINIGVQVWLEYLNTTSFPHRMGVSTNGSRQFTSVTTKYIDFKTGQPVQGYIPPADKDRDAALKKYLELCEKYEDMLIPGFFNFPEPENIPEDLVMSFGDFVKKHNLTAVVPRLWDATAMGVGNLMEVPTMYTIQAFGVPMARALLGLGKAMVPASGNLHELYERVEEFLGDDVLFNTTVTSSTRHNNSVSVTVRNANGTTTEITAKHLLIAIEPTLENMAPFGLDQTEKDVFAKLEYTTVYAGLVKHPSLQPNTSYFNTLPNAPINYTNFPQPSQVGKINQQAGANNLFAFTAVGTDKDSAESMQTLIKKSIDNFIAAGVIPATNQSAATFPAFGDHGKMHSRVTSEELRNGFIQKQLALQGRRSTWYTGAAFSTGFSTVLWAYNEVLLPQMLGGA